MRRSTVLAFGLLLSHVAGVTGVATGRAQIAAGDRVPGVLIVKFADGVAPQYQKGLSGGQAMGLPSLDQLNSQFQLISFRRLFRPQHVPPPPRKPLALERYHVLRFDNSQDLDAAAAAYRADPGVESVDFDSYALMDGIPNDPQFPQMWNLRQVSDHDVDAELAWDVTVGSPSIVLGVTDTGVLYTHEDLAGNIWVNPGEDLDSDGVVYDPDDANSVDDDGNGYVDDLIGWDFVEDAAGSGYPPWPGEDGAVADNDPKDFNGHGSHTSGTVAAVTNNSLGVSGLAGGFGGGAPGCKIMCLRMGWSFDNFGSEGGVTQMSYVAEAFVYAADMGARAINYSFGSGPSGGIEAATDYAVALGVNICASAGNSNSSGGFGYLQSRSDVIAIASTNQDDGKSYFSNYGPLVDISAPGSDILSTVSNHYTPGYAVYSGTSMAAPHVVGLIGLILSLNPGLTRTDVLDIITATADPTTDYVGQMGAGRINAYNAALESRALRISHVPLSNTADTLNLYTVVANIVSDTALRADSLALFYRTSIQPDTDFVRVPLMPTGMPNEYSATIPPQPVYTEIEYGLTAEDERGDRVAAPVTFPSSPYAFRILGVPILVYYPDSFNVELPSGYTETETLTVRNDGTDDLLFSLGVGRLDTAAINSRVRVVLAANAAVVAAADAPSYQGESVHAATIPRLAAEEILAGRSRFASSVGPPVFAVVLDSWGADNAGGADWDYLNANYGDFGSTPVLIDYATFNHNDITYAELEAGQPDVLIVSDAWNVSFWEFTPSEMAAIRQYVEEGHGLFVTAGTLDFENAPGHMAAFAALLGLDSTKSYRWSFATTQPQNLQIAGHPLFRNVPDPYTVSFPVSTVPTADAWPQAVSEAEVVAVSTDGSTVTTAFGNRVYASSMPEEIRDYGQNPADDQMTYNTIVYCAGGLCDWLSVEPVAGVVPPHDSVFVNVRLDATPIHQDTTLGCQINLRALDSVGSDVAIRVGMHVLPPEYYVDLSPTSAAGVGPAGDTVWYTDTLTNFGANDDFYHLIVSQAQWPTTVWDSGGTAEITTTPILSQNDRYVIRPRVIIPDSAGYGQADTLQLTVRSAGDTLIAGQFEAITYSVGRPDTIPWSDPFLFPTPDTLHWQIVLGATVDDRGIGEPSPPYSLNLNGNPTGGDMVTSVPINLAGQIQVVLSYWFEQTGGGEEVDPGEDLIFEILDDSSRWVEVSRQPGSGPNMYDFQHVEAILPRSGYHEDFRLRIRSIGSGCPCDDWFVDDVLIYAPIPPSLCYAPGSFSFTLSEGDSTTDSLMICNGGPGDLRLVLTTTAGQPGAAGTVFPKRLPVGSELSHGLPLSSAEPAPPIPQPANNPDIQGLAEDFEDGDFADWTIESGPYLRSVTSTTAAAGTVYSFTQTGGQYYGYDGVSHPLSPASYEYVGFYVRLSSAADAAGYVVVGDENTTYNGGTIFFYAYSGYFTVYPGDQSFPYDVDRWYHVEFRLDWGMQSFDYYVDEMLIAAALPFRNPTTQFTQIHLYNYHFSTAWWDEISVGDGPLSGSWLTLSPRADTIPPGETTFVTLGINASTVISGDYLQVIALMSNDPYNPQISVPVSLRVRGPELTLGVPNAIFNLIETGTYDQDAVRITNTGEETLAVTGVVVDQPWLQASLVRVEPGPHDSMFADVSVPLSGVQSPPLDHDSLGPGESDDVVIRMEPYKMLPGTYAGTVTVFSNDADEPETDIPILVHIGPDPDIEIVPESLAVIVAPGDSATSVLEVQNVGEGTLWIKEMRTQFAEDSATLLSSPVFTGSPVVENKETVEGLPPGRPDNEAIYSQYPPSGPTVSPSSPMTAPDLDYVRTHLNMNYAAITGAIPSRYDFSEGESGSYILDGGNDMYDGGNYLSAISGGFSNSLPYSNDVVIPSAAFGPGGRYFTRKYPGLFVLAADMEGVEYFKIDGNLGADGSGNVDGAILQTTFASRTYYGFVKRVFHAFDPSVNHLIIVERAASHDFSMNSNDDYHSVFNLGGVRRLYYLLYAGADGYYIDNASTLAIMDAFLQNAGIPPPWLSADLEADIVNPNGSADLTAQLRAAGLVAPDYFASIIMLTNDLDEDTVVIPVHLHIHSPEVEVRPTSVFVEATEGAVTDSVLWLINRGDGDLEVSGVGDSAWLSLVPPMVAVAPGDSQAVAARVDGALLLPGDVTAALILTTNDYDEGEIVVPVEVHVGPDPDINVVPESLAVTLTAGDSTSTMLEIQNLGLGTLAFKAEAQVGGPPATLTDAPYPASYYDPLPKGAMDSRQGRPVVMGSGGPDSAGYRWIDSDEPGGPAFAWVDIAATGTLVGGLSDDNFVGPFPVGFEFPYYDSTYTQFWIASNGFIGFGPTDRYYDLSGDPIPSPFPPNNIIAWLWRDLYPSAGSDPTTVHYQTIGDRLVVQFTRVRNCCNDGPWITAEIVLERSGRILIQYLDIQPSFGTSYGTIGIENRTGTVGLEVAFNVDYLHAPLAIQISRIPNWLAVNPDYGIVSSGATMPLEVAINSQDLDGPDHYATIELSSNDPDENPAHVPVHLHLRSPEITVRPGALLMDVLEGGTADSTLWLVNTGDGDLNAALSGDAPWLSANPVMITVVPADSAPVAAHADGGVLIPGDYTGTLTVASNDFDEPEVTVGVQVHVGPDPDIAVDPESLSVTLNAGDSSTSEIQIHNTGPGTLAFAVDVNFLPGPPPVTTFSPIPSVASSVPLPAVSNYQAIPSPDRIAHLGGSPAAIPFPGYASGIAFGEAGQLYAASIDDGRILRLGAGGWEEFATGIGGPYGVAFDVYGDLAVAGYYDGVVYRVYSDGTVHVLASGLGASPLGLAYGPDGDLFVTMDGSSSLRRIDPDGTVSPFASGLPYTTFGAAFGPDNRLYVSTFDDGRILAIAPDGSWTTYVAIELFLEGLAFDVAGNLYCGNGYMGYVYRINTNQSVDLIGTGYPGPLNLALDETGLLYISSLAVQQIDTLRVGIPGVRLPVTVAWLSLTPESGLVPGGGSAILDAHVTTDRLNGADFYAEIVVSSNDPDENPVAVPVHLHVEPVTNCRAECHGDPQCDGVVADALDVVRMVAVTFRGAPAIPDPDPSCPFEDTDVDCSHSTDVLDIVRIVNVAFRGADPAREFCNPCR